MKFYANKYYNKMDRFLERHKLSKHTQEEMDNLNILMYILILVFK